MPEQYSEVQGHSTGMVLTSVINGAASGGTTSVPRTHAPHVKPLLPQLDPNPTARFERLSEQQARYKYDYRPVFLPQDDPAIDGIKFPVLQSPVPREDSFTAKYIAGRVRKTLPVYTNKLLTKARSLFDPLDKLEDYDDCFIRLREPAVTEFSGDDQAFAEQRISGCNPLALAVLKQEDPRVAVLDRIDNPDFAAKAKAAVQEGRCFVADYTGEDPAYPAPSFVQGGQVEFDGKTFQKWLPKPLSFFMWDTEADCLQPLAVEVTRGGRVFTPADAMRPGILGLLPIIRRRDDWLFAKICVGIADGNHHEMWNHLARTHFTMEPVAISLQRQVHSSHPLSLLLSTHMRFHCANNNLAHDTLVADGGHVDTCWAGTRSESLQMVYQGVRTWHIKDMSFPEDIKARGLHDTANLPHYPWRDDGILVWIAIHKFVGSYFEHFYPSDADVEQDSEIQAWAAELADKESGGMVNGFPSRITTVEELVELVATIIMQVTAVHCAVNFLQYEYEGLASNMTFASYVDPEELASKRKIRRKDILAMLPPFGAVTTQVSLMYALCAYRYDVLGEYQDSFKDLYSASVEEVFREHTAILTYMNTFQKDLEAVEEVIVQRNAERRIAYDGMLPSKLLNSNSI